MGEYDCVRKEPVHHQLDDSDPFIFVAQPVDEISNRKDVDDQCSNARHCGSARDLINLERNEETSRDDGQILGPPALVPQTYSFDHVEGGVEKNNDAQRKTNVDKEVILIYASNADTHHDLTISILPTNAVEI